MEESVVRASLMKVYDELHPTGMFDPRKMRRELIEIIPLAPLASYLERVVGENAEWHRVSLEKFENSRKRLLEIIAEIDELLKSSNIAMDQRLEAIAALNSVAEDAK